MLHKKGILCGMSIKPNTPISMLEPFIRSLDMVLIMTVEPGKSGQTFIEGSMDRIREAKALIDRLNHFCKLEVDGGITEGRLENLRKAGVDYVVMGSNLYNAKDKKAIVAQFDD
jgi:ribulose-phosphate 3-epimerase